MPPALDKTVEKDAGVRMSPPVLSRGADMDAPGKPADESYTRFWLNLSSLSALDFCSVKSLLELTEMPLQPLFNNSASRKTDLQPALLGSVSADKRGADFSSLNEDSRLKGRTAPEEESGTVVKDQQSLTKTLSPLEYVRRESKPPAWERSSGNRNSNRSKSLRPEWHATSRGAMQEKADARRTRLASRLGALATRADLARVRLHALSGENALQSVNRQLGQIKEKLSTTSRTRPGSDPLRPADSRCADAANASRVHEEGDRPPGRFSQQASSASGGPAVQQGSGTLGGSSVGSLLVKTSERVQLIRSVQSLVRCGQELLRREQKNLDPDATESSSDDEQDQEGQRQRPSTGCLGCEWKYQRERAKLASQWTRMNLRLSELESQIRKVSQLRQHLLANKEGVVLAETQPLTDLQIQQTPLTETTGLTLTAGQTHDLNSELDTEPSSPTRLLRNIQRQSAQLSQIVNSLMSPLSDSPSRPPVAEGDTSCRRGSRKRPFYSTGTSTFQESGSSRNRQAGRRRRWPQSQVDVTHACARTRPLLTYHKPCLFVTDQSPVTQQEADSSAYRYSNSTNKSAVSHWVRPASFKEDWLHRWPSIVLPPSFTTAEKRTTSIFTCGRELQAARTHREAPPPRDTPTAKRRRQRGTAADARVASRTGRRRSGESIYRINDLVVPVSPDASTAVEKLHYKDIPTPSWRIVQLSPLKKKKETDRNEVESLSNEVFIQRHRSYERTEKLCWSSWEKGRRCTHRTRFSGSTDAPSDGDPQWWRCSTPADAPPHNMEEREPEPPWERRAFPLSETRGLALRSKDQEMDSSLSGSSCKNRVSSVCARAHTTLCRTNTEQQVTPEGGRVHTDFFPPLHYGRAGLPSRM